MIKKIRHYYGACRVTAAAEIQLVSSQQRAMVFHFSADMRQQAETMLALLCQEYPFMRYEIREAVLSTSINLFTYQSACADTKFLDHLREWFSQMLQAMIGKSTCTATLQCSGRIGYAGKWRDFAMLNKGTDVQYKVTGEVPQGWSERILGSAYCRIGLTILFIGVLIWCAYDHLAPAQAIAGQLV